MKRRFPRARRHDALTAPSMTAGAEGRSTFSEAPRGARSITLFLCGDVMTGRGIDQVLAHPSRPTLYESYVRSALDYVALAERRVGPLPRRVGPDYIWGEALQMLA